MHHPTDVAAGLLVGIGTLIVAVAAARVAAAAADEERPSREPVAVIAHAGKSIDGGLPELRRTLARHGDHRSAVGRGAEEQARPRKQVERLLDTGGRALLRLGR